MQLGQILLKKKWISAEQLEAAIQQQASKPHRLGDVLIEQGVIIHEQLDHALKEQYWRNNGFWVID